MLGEFLKAHRARVNPQDAGIPSHTQRKVKGLRREEVAVLAGVSADYYARLEQGRETNPSAQVLDALSRALQLDTDARAHMHRLAGVVAVEGHATDTVSPELLQLMSGMHDMPAFVMNGLLDMLAMNALAEALYEPFTPADNAARMTFLDPAAARFYPRWNWVAQSTVAHLRQTADPKSRRLKNMVEELNQNPVFKELWEHHEVRGKTQDAKEFVHPAVGPIKLNYHSFDVREAPGQFLVVYRAEPGPNADALKLLATSRATRAAASPGTTPVPLWLTGTARSRP
ncbi:helix-turn-helix transcriptional regulator [Lentzea sp. BCCO 10_0061]|uniref:Helix-turn-helix transcriptional regulator n=1 Tax=Lentzea sokolovensis TaxID=3095429 RepID=A0ABU4V1P1_9PSEU|nr:helix-turn-helix transcriptional regulator [Lentzea sp. BCCO 10_0061]MDX8145691.1 helix-turn-helix transcriptional regulator [Lentzea sp. BCCO 10_0061]